MASITITAGTVKLENDGRAVEFPVSSPLTRVLLDDVTESDAPFNVVLEEYLDLKGTLVENNGQPQGTEADYEEEGFIEIAPYSFYKELNDQASAHRHYPYLDLFKPKTYKIRGHYRKADGELTTVTNVVTADGPINEYGNLVVIKEDSTPRSYKAGGWEDLFIKEV
jgi:hypothetical protein